MARRSSSGRQQPTAGLKETQNTFSGASKMEFITTTFENSHGRKPKGRGLWAFSVAMIAGDWPSAAHTVFFNGTYTDAKKAARDFVKLNPSSVKLPATIKVLP
jgi:hypothetical protein